MQQSMDISGYQEKQDNIRELKIIPNLEVVENQYAGEDYLVELKTNEFTTVCPKTGLPDFAIVIIHYKPDLYLVEQKSLKLYLTGYRNIGIFQEHATNKILTDFIACVQPKWAKIETIWNARGGIDVRVEQEYLQVKN
ncbi:NADPH-dependent 7-cyano-7-deazaguanine reductase QueF [Candidatus Desantisbacteria bacterium]|nr:NADPH-dependent 7-cyano-7-deazaguanine reductase QueF [Candidatus Desantisbacteria bacterium]